MRSRDIAVAGDPFVGTPLRGAPLTQSGNARLPPTLRRGAPQLLGAASTAATARMATDLPWFDDLSAEDRSWVGLIVQAGIRGFVDWYDVEAGAQGNGEWRRGPPPARRRGLRGRAACADRRHLAPADRRACAAQHPGRRVQHRLDPRPGGRARGPRRRAPLRPRSRLRHGSRLRPGRGESRGAWDARLEALVVDAVVRSEADETVLSRASALGWGAHGDVAVVLGATPPHHAEGSCSPVRTPLRPRGGHGCALCHPGRSPGRPAGRRHRPAQGRDALLDPLRRRAGGGRAGDGRPRPRERLGTGRAVGAPGRQRVARRTATGREPATFFPSARWPATATRGGTSSRTSTCRSWPPGALCWRPWGPGSSTARRSRERRGRSSSTRTPCATDCDRSPTSRGGRRRVPARPSPCSWR